MCAQTWELLPQSVKDEIGFDLSLGEVRGIPNEISGFRKPATGKSKYGNKKTVVDDIAFDSKKRLITTAN